MVGNKLKDILLQLVKEEYFLFIMNESPSEKHEQFGLDYVDLYVQVTFSRETAHEYYKQIEQYKDRDDIATIFGKYFEMTEQDKEFELVKELMNQLVDSDIYEMEIEDLLNERHQHADFYDEEYYLVRAEMIHENGRFYTEFETKKMQEDRLYHVFNWKIKHERDTIIEKFTLENGTGIAIEKKRRKFG